MCVWHRSRAGGDGWILMRSQCDRCSLRFMPALMDRAARSPFHCARANASRCVRRLEVAVRRSAGALAAARQQSYGCAYSDVRWGSTGTTFNIITTIPIYISHGGCRNVHASGVCVSSRLPTSTRSLSCGRGLVWDSSGGGHLVDRKHNANNNDRTLWSNIGLHLCSRCWQPARRSQARVELPTRTILMPSPWMQEALALLSWSWF